MAALNEDMELVGGRAGRRVRWRQAVLFYMSVTSSDPSGSLQVNGGSQQCERTTPSPKTPVAPPRRKDKVQNNELI